MLDELLHRYPALVPLYRNDPNVRVALDLAERQGATPEAALALALEHVAEVKSNALRALERETASRPAAPIMRLGRKLPTGPYE